MSRDEWVEEALRALEQGTPMEQILRRHPEHAEALRTLLYAADQIRRARPPAPSLQRERAARAAFLARAEALRREPRWRRLAALGWGWAARGVPLGAAALLFLVFLFALQTAAQHSLPGDPLYAWKRAEEQFWLALAWDPMERRNLEERFARRRWEEYRTLAQRRGSGTVAWRGPLEAMDGSTWRVGGIALLVFPETEIQGPIRLGQEVEVTAFLGPAGEFIALRVVGSPAAPAPSSTPTPAPTPTQALTATPTPRPPAAPRSSPTPAPTETPAPTASPPPVPTREPTPTLRPTRTPTSTPGEEEGEWKGTLQAIAGTTWVIDGRAVEVTAETEIRGNPQVGDRVEVKARRRADGVWIALQIKRED